MQPMNYSIDPLHKFMHENESDVIMITIDNLSAYLFLRFRYFCDLFLRIWIFMKTLYNSRLHMYF